MNQQYLFSKFNSIIYRQSNRFYERQLAQYQIGGGQQFFLLRIYENEGINLFDLGAMGRFDKGTVSKAIQKLEELNYITIKTCPNDKRIRRLYTTKAAQPVIKELYATREKWNSILTAGLSKEEIELAHRLLSKMATNAYESMLSKESDRNE